MRLWSLHPEYLDTKGLLAVWREGLLARKVLEGKTKGYRNHPQLERFKEQTDPMFAIDAYLHAIVEEATCRGYSFDATKLAVINTKNVVKIPVTTGQLIYEWQHLLRKLADRDAERHMRFADLVQPNIHSLFVLIEGDIAPWEKI